MDRLSRSLLDFSKLSALFDEYEMSFVSVTRQFNSTTSMGRLTLNILLSFAQFEREIIGERIRDKKLAHARQGKYIGGQPCQKIAETLNAEGPRTKQYETKTGKTFSETNWKGRNLYDILTDQKYIGRIDHKGVSYPAEHKVIAKDELFLRVQLVLRSHKTYSHKHQASRFALFRRMLGAASAEVWFNRHGLGTTALSAGIPPVRKRTKRVTRILRSHRYPLTKSNRWWWISCDPFFKTRP